MSASLCVVASTAEALDDEPPNAESGTTKAAKTPPMISVCLSLRSCISVYLLDSPGFEPRMSVDRDMDGESRPGCRHMTDLDFVPLALATIVAGAGRRASRGGTRFDPDDTTVATDHPRQ